jgi:hypothetical protein
MKPAPDEKSDIEIAFAPVENVGRAFWAMPTAIWKDIESGKIGTGEKWYQEQVAPDMKETLSTRLFEGKWGEVTDPSKQRENVITGLVEGAMIFAPVGVSKGILPKINFPKINWSLPKNPFGKPSQSSLDKMYGAPKPPRDVFAQDTALAMDQTKINLGSGLLSQGLPRNLSTQPSNISKTKGVFESWFKPDKSQPRKFEDPKPGVGEKIVTDPATGMLKIVKTKQVTKTVQQTKVKVQNGKTKVQTKTKLKTLEEQAQLFRVNTKTKTKTKTVQAFAPVFRQAGKLDQPFPPVLTTTQSFKQPTKYKPAFVLVTEPTIPIPPMLKIPGGLPLFPGGRGRGGGGTNAYRLNQKFGEWDIKESPLIFGESFRESGRPALRVTKRPGAKKSKNGKNGKKKNKSRKRKR